MTNETCHRCGATHGTTIRRLRDTVYCEVTDRDFDNFVAYIRKYNVTGDAARAKFGYELVQVTTIAGKAFCTHCAKIAAATALKNRNKTKPDNSANTKLF